MWPKAHNSGHLSRVRCRACKSMAAFDQHCWLICRQKICSPFDEEVGLHCHHARPSSPPYSWKLRGTLHVTRGKIYVFGPKFSVFWPKSVAQIIPILAQISYYFGPNHCVFGPKYYVFGPNYYVFGTFLTWISMFLAQIIMFLDQIDTYLALLVRFLDQILSFLELVRVNLVRKELFTELYRSLFSLIWTAHWLTN